MVLLNDDSNEPIRQKNWFRIPKFPFPFFLSNWEPSYFQRKRARSRISVDEFRIVLQDRLKKFGGHDDDVPTIKRCKHGCY